MFILKKGIIVKESFLEACRDLNVFGMTFVLVMITWFLLGWNPDLLVGNGDMLQGAYPINKLLEIHDYKKINWSPTLMGGSYIYPLVGSSLVSKFLFEIGLSVGNILNGVVILIQTISAFFTYSLILVLMPEIKNKKWKFQVLALSVLLISFNPIVAWRIEHGHANFLWAITFFLGCSFTLISIFKEEKIGIIPLTLFWLTGIESLSQHSYQLLVYMIFPAAVFFLIILRSPKKRPQGMVLLTILFSIFFFVAPGFFSMIRYFSSDFVSRNIETKAIYSYLVAGWSDVDSIFVIIPSLLRSGRSAFLNHEMHYPFTLPFMFFILYWREFSNSFKMVAKTITILALLIFYLSLNPPLLGQFLENLPIISTFRIVGRANILMGISAYFLLLLVLVKSEVNRKNALILTIGLLSCLVLKNIVWISEFVLWIIFMLSAVTVYIPTRSKHKSLLLESFNIISILVVFSSMSSIIQPVTNFREIDLEIDKTRVFLNNNNLLSDNMIVYQGPLKEKLGLNATMAIGVGGIEGYWFPQIKYLNNFSFAQEVDPSPMRMLFQIQNENQFKILSEIYPIEAIVLCTHENCSITSRTRPAKYEPMLPLNFLPETQVEYLLMGISLFLLIMTPFLNRTKLQSNR